MSLFSRIFNRWGQSAISNLLVQNYENTVIWPDISKLDTYTDSYKGNGDVFTVINKIIEPAARIPVLHLNDKGEEIGSSKTLALLNAPAPFTTSEEFFESLMGSYLVYGNTYMNVIRPEGGINVGRPVRIEVLPPPNIFIQVGTRLDPIKGYVMIYLGQELAFPIEDIMHWKEYNPDWGDNFGVYGMSRLSPIIKSVTASDSAYQSMVSAFKNQGAHGILTILGVKEKDGSYNDRAVTRQQMASLKNQFKPGGNMVGDINRAKIAATTKSVEWTNLGLSPVDLNILNSLGVTRGVIADAYNVPNQLLSGSNDRTYNNYQEAARSLWTNAIMPVFDGALSQLSRWLIPQMGEKGYLQADYSGVEVLQKNKKELIEWMIRAGSFTRNEIREAAGYEPSTLDGMDQVYISMGEIPIDEQMPGMDDTEKLLRYDYREGKD